MSINAPTTSICPTLEGPSNFTIWNIRIRGALSEKQVLGVVTGTDLKPSPPSTTLTTKSTTTSTTSVATVKTTYNDTWDVRDEKATGIIQWYLSDNILLSIGSKASAKELYDAIVKRYNETNVVTTAFHTLANLVSLKYELPPSPKSMSEHTASFLAHSNRLSMLGIRSQ